MNAEQHKWILAIRILIIPCMAMTLTTLGTGCLTVPRAKLETPRPIGTTYWGEPVNGLRAGLAIEGPGGGEKGNFWEAPGVRLVYKLQNVSTHSVRLLRARVHAAEVMWMSPSSKQQWPETYRMPKLQQSIVELAPGEEVTGQWYYRPDSWVRKPYSRTLQFEYYNYAPSATLADGEVVKTIDGFWTGRVSSSLLPVKVR